MGFRAMEQLALTSMNVHYIRTIVIPRQVVSTLKEVLAAYAR